MSTKRIFVKTQCEKFLFNLKFLRADRTSCVVNNELMDTCVIFLELEYMCSNKSICGTNKKQLSICVDRETGTSNPLCLEQSSQCDVSLLVQDHFTDVELFDIRNGENVVNDFCKHLDDVAVPQIYKEICSYAEECAAAI